jgi:hypothetical protein
MNKLDKNFYVCSPSNILGLLSNDYKFSKYEKPDFLENTQNDEKQLTKQPNPVIANNVSRNIRLEYGSVMHYIFGRPLKTPQFLSNGNMHAFTEFSNYIATAFLEAGQSYLRTLVDMERNNFISETFENSEQINRYLTSAKADKSLFEYVIEKMNERYNELKTLKTQYEQSNKLYTYMEKDTQFVTSESYRNYVFSTTVDDAFFFSLSSEFPEVTVKNVTYKNIGTYICLFVRDRLIMLDIPPETKYNYGLASMYNELSFVVSKFTTIGVEIKFKKMKNSNVFKYALRILSRFNSVDYIMDRYDFKQKFLNNLLLRIINQTEDLFKGYRVNLMSERIEPIIGASIQDDAYTEYEKLYNVKVVDFMNLNNERTKKVSYAECLRLRVVGDYDADNSLIKRIVDQRYMETVRVRSILSKIMLFPRDDQETYIRVYNSFLNGSGIGYTMVKYERSTDEYEIRVFVEADNRLHMSIKFTNYDLYNPEDKYSDSTTYIPFPLERAILKSIIIFQYLCFDITTESTFYDMLLNHTTHFATLGTNLQKNMTTSILDTMEEAAIKNVYSQILNFSNVFKYDVYSKYTDNKDFGNFIAKQIVYALQIKNLNTDKTTSDRMFNKHLRKNTQFVDTLIKNYSTIGDSCGCGAKSEETGSSNKTIIYPEFPRTF